MRLIVKNSAITASLLDNVRPLRWQDGLSDLPAHQAMLPRLARANGPTGSGWMSAALVVPVFLYRHYIVDGGKFPSDMSKDLLLWGQTQLGPKRAGVLPYLALAGGVAVMLAATSFSGEDKSRKCRQLPASC
jgi:hypothetical protein